MATAIVKKKMMKKMKVLALAVVCFFAVASVAQAQTKIGYLSIENMVRVMPEAAKIDSIMDKFRIDTIGAERTRIEEEFTYKDSILKQDDSLKKIGGKVMPETVRKQHEKDVQELYMTLAQWRQVVEEWEQGKQQQLVGPIYQKVLAAIQTVAKEKGYTHVMDESSFIIKPDGDNIIKLVADKLKVTLPAQLLPGYKPTAPAIR